MTKLINKSKLTTFTSKLWDKITASFVSKTLPNNVIGETVFSDGHIEGAMLNHFNNKNPQMIIGSGTGDCFGVPNNSVNAGIYVGRIALAVNPSLVVGSSVNSVVALAVRKRNNEVMEVITRDSQAKVYNNPYRSITADKIIYIDINKKFSEEVYFVIGCNGLLWNTDTPPHRANVYGSSTIPAINERLTIADYGYSGRFIIFTGKTSFEELVSLRNDSVSKTKDNIVTGKTILQDGYIDGELYSYNNPNIEGAATGNGVYSGTNNKVVPTNQHVTSIIIAVNNDLELGATVTGVNIGVVRHSNNQVMEYIVQNGTATVVENNYPQRITATKVINVIVDKKWTEDVYLLVGANGMLWGRVRGTNGVTTATGGNSLPNVGSTISNLNESNYVGKVVALGSSISLNTITSKVDVSEIGNAPHQIPRVGTNGKLDPSILPPEQNGGVRTVNDRSPDSRGNVTVLAEHIKYANGQDITIKRAIDNKPNTVNGRGVNLNDGNITIYADNINISSSNSQKISEALGERAHKNQDNIFTKHNRFNDYSPTVHRLFTRKYINSGINPDNVAVYNADTYFAPLNEKYTERNKHISHVLLPIKGANVGDSISINYFIYNNNGTVIYQQNWAKYYTVIDEEVAGCKCAKIDVNRDSGDNGIGFGFVVFTSNVGGRAVGAACLKSVTGANVSWVNRHNPQQNQTISPNSNISFPYKICYETTSEVVTRFELENVTQMYHKTLIGEYKNISYDAGNTLDDGTNTWLKANGQAVTNTDYPELFEKLNPNRIINDLDNIQVETFELPNEAAAAGYYYICAK